MKKFDRRDFLKVLATTAAGALALKTLLPKSARAKSNASVQGDHSWAMVIDQELCIGCRYCVNACQASNDTSPAINWNKVYQLEPVADRQVYLSVSCMHCEHAPCVSVCPVKASYYRDDGIVMMDYDRCIGCRYCQVACPYQARSFNWEVFDGENPKVPAWGEPDVERRLRGVVEKCTFCYQKIDRGLAAGLTPGVDPAATPACVGACPTGARKFGDLNDPHSPISKALANSHHYRLREELGTGPRVYYLPVNHDTEEKR